MWLLLLSFAEPAELILVLINRIQVMSVGLSFESETYEISKSKGTNLFVVSNAQRIIVKPTDRSFY